MSSTSSPASDPLSAHPLLSPPSSAQAFPKNLAPPSEGAQAVSSNSPASSTAPRYVPYTPRQRSTAATTASPVSVAMSSPPSITNPNGQGATEKLQLQSLKATIQTMGLDNASVGWAILEKLYGNDQHGTEWDQIWQVIASGGVALALPTEAASSSLIVTPELVRDHVVFCCYPSQVPGPMVTMGGLKGTADHQTLIFRSALDRDSSQHKSILSPASRVKALLELSSVPLGEDSASPYPAIRISSILQTLQLPPRPTPPPLNPTSRPVAPASRLGNPFASLFSKPLVSAPAHPNRPLSPRPSSIMSDASLDAVNPYSSEGVNVAALAIEKMILRKDVGKGTQKALKAHVKAQLATLPTWVPDRILSFTATLQPFSKSGSLKKQRNELTPSSAANSTLPNASKQTSPGVLDDGDPHSMSDSVQEFLEKIEEDLSKSWQSLKSKMPEEGKAVSEDLSQSQTISVSEDEAQNRVSDAMEQIEACITTTFYDHLFLPSVSDDSSHDEAVANRIAALSVLDLDWDHLGVDIGSDPAAVDGVTKLVARIGEILKDLQEPANRSPKAKVDLLVKSHTAIVDGLSNLPPIRLKPEHETEQSVDTNATDVPAQQDLMTPMQIDFSPKQVVESDALPAMSLPSPKLETEENVAISAAFPLPVESVSNSTVAVVAPIVTTDGEAPPPPDPPLSLANDPSLGPLNPPNEAQRTTAKTEVNTDVLLPILIYSVVKANPVQLVSHLLFIERFRYRRVGGEASFCLINFLAVVEFLENVDLSALGLGEAERVMSIDSLTPLPISPTAAPIVPVSVSASFRGRVEQQVGDLAVGANRVISGVGGVVDQSFTVLRGLLTVTTDPNSAGSAGTHTTAKESMVAQITRPGFGLLKRGTSFTLGAAAVAAGAAGHVTSLGKDRKAVEEGGQQLLEVPSRPPSVYHADHIRSPSESASPEKMSRASSIQTNEDDDESVAVERAVHEELSAFAAASKSSASPRERDKADTRSIRSFSSMLTKELHQEEKRERATLSDRFASIPALNRVAGQTPPGSRRTSIRSPNVTEQLTITSPLTERLDLPGPRFLDYSVEDLKMSDIPILLAEYKRLAAAAVQRAGGQT